MRSSIGVSVVKRATWWVPVGGAATAVVVAAWLAMPLGPRE